MAAVVHGAAARPKGERIDSRVGASRGQRGESTPSLTLGNGMLAGLVTRQVEPDSHGIGIWIRTCSKCVVDASHSSREFLVGRGPLACFSRGDVLRTFRIPGPRAIGSMHHGGIGLRAQATRGALRWQRRQVRVGWRHGRTADLQCGTRNRSHGLHGALRRQVGMPFTEHQPQHKQQEREHRDDPANTLLAWQIGPLEQGRYRIAQRLLNTSHRSSIPISSSSICAKRACASAILSLPCE